ncbi:hypothetical protein [Pendulispora albinea]|uniref:Secreted protein n=1 Tax=Pendulispora albinea TaxID=2741071 RepID=A0ABZ2LVM2_9BACT
MQRFINASVASFLLVTLACASGCSGSSNGPLLLPDGGGGGNPDKDSDSKPPPDGGSHGRTGAEQACLDTMDAIAKQGPRCGIEYQALYDALIQSSAGGACANVIQIRDENALRQQCFPSLQNISCKDLEQANLDPSCRGQLLRARTLRSQTVQSEAAETDIEAGRSVGTFLQGTSL